MFAKLGTLMVSAAIFVGAMATAGEVGAVAAIGNAGAYSAATVAEPIVAVVDVPRDGQLAMTLMPRSAKVRIAVLGGVFLVLLGVSRTR